MDNRDDGIEYGTKTSVGEIMKVRQIGEKIGDIDIPLPSKSTITKVRTLTLRLYSIGYIGLLIFLLGGMGSQLLRYYNGSSRGLDRAGEFLIAIVVIITFHTAIKWSLQTILKKIKS